LDKLLTDWSITISQETPNFVHISIEAQQRRAQATLRSIASHHSLIGISIITSISLSKQNHHSRFSAHSIGAAMLVQ